jgi:hypothetical protein
MNQRIGQPMQSALIGVSVSPYGAAEYRYLGLRFRLRGEHLKFLRDPERISIRGQPANGFILAADKKNGVKPNRSNLSDGCYLQASISNYEISKVPRKRIEVRPDVEMT